MSFALQLGLAALADASLGSARTHLLIALQDPNLDVLLLTLGGLLICLEFNLPGTVVPGALGLLLALLGGFGLSLLPVNPAALLLVCAAFALFALELHLSAHGAGGLAGIAALVFGLATLVDGAARVQPATAVAAGVGFGAVFCILTWIALRARRNKTLLGAEAMLGKCAVALNDLAPAGQVAVRGEIWHASLLTPAAALPAGSPVLVRQIQGLTLLVEPAQAETRTGRVD